MKFVGSPHYARVEHGRGLATHGGVANVMLPSKLTVGKFSHVEELRGAAKLPFEVSLRKQDTSRKKKSGRAKSAPTGSPNQLNGAVHVRRLKVHVTDEGAGAASRGRATRYFVTNNEDQFKPLHETPLTKKGLKGFLEDQGE